MATVIRAGTASCAGAEVPLIASSHLDVDPDIQQALSCVLPSPIVCHGGPIAALQAPLHPVEARSVQGAVAKRVREFTAGRTAARAALKRLGYDDVAIPVGRRRQPVWPSGITGSISHVNDYCVAAVCPRTRISSLGLDIEQMTPLSESLIDLVCLAEEKERFACMEGGPGLIAKLTFSAKEAVFKCLFPVYGEELEFQDVSLDISLHDGRYIAQISRLALNSDSDLEVHGRFTCTSRLVISAAILQDDDILHLAGWNPGTRMQACAGRYICTSQG